MVVHHHQSKTSHSSESVLVVGPGKGSVKAVASSSSEVVVGSGKCV